MNAWQMPRVDDISCGEAMCACADHNAHVPERVAATRCLVPLEAITGILHLPDQFSHHGKVEVSWTQRREAEPCNDRSGCVVRLALAMSITCESCADCGIFVCSPAFFCFGWNQAVAGGVLTLKSFVLQFPQMDTVFTSGAQRHENSTIQGTTFSVLSAISV